MSGREGRRGHSNHQSQSEVVPVPFVTSQISESVPNKNQISSSVLLLFLPLLHSLLRLLAPPTSSARWRSNARPQRWLISQATSYVSHYLLTPYPESVTDDFWPTPLKTHNERDGKTPNTLKFEYEAEPKLTRTNQVTSPAGNNLLPGNI